MSIRWHFNTVRAGDRARESQVEKFFQSDAVRDRSDAMIREGIQNSLDAAPDEKIVRVRLTLGSWTATASKQIWQQYSPGLNEHIAADSKKLPQPPNEIEPFRFLVFEDYETSGLKGDPSQWRLQEGAPSNPYFNFFRAEGISDKLEGDRGRHGVGKFVFAAASRIRAMIGLTIREEDSRELLMGTTTLHYHDVQGQEYMPDGWFGIDDIQSHNNTLPVEKNTQFIERFKRDFRLSRLKEPGLSIVVPWLDETVSTQAIICSAIRGYYYPIMRNLLVVEVVDEDDKLTRVNSQTIKDITKSMGAAFAEEMQSILELASLCIDSKDRITLSDPPGTGAPKWEKECIPESALESMQQRLDSGSVLALTVPIRIRKDKVETRSAFDVFLQRDAARTDSDIQFIREGIIITEVKPRRTAGIRGLVVIDQGPLASFLGDAENPSHTHWLKERVRGRYSFHGATLDYVIHAIPEVIKLLSHEQKKPDPLPMRDLFYLPEEPPDTTPTKQKKRTSKSGDIPPPPPDGIPLPKPRSYSLNKIDGGFVLRRDNTAAPLPQSITLTMAYGRRQGNPFKKYDKADFRLESRDIKIDHNNVTIVERQDNRLVIEPLNDQFEVKVTGFDGNRDLHIDPKVIKRDVEEVENAQTV